MSFDIADNPNSHSGSPVFSKMSDAAAGALGSRFRAAQPQEIHAQGAFPVAAHAASLINPCGLRE